VRCDKAAGRIGISGVDREKSNPVGIEVGPGSREELAHCRVGVLTCGMEDCLHCTGDALVESGIREQVQEKASFVGRWGGGRRRSQRFQRLVLSKDQEGRTKLIAREEGKKRM
jgi:hypothetical protein